MVPHERLEWVWRVPATQGTIVSRFDEFASLLWRGMNATFDCNAFEVMHTGTVAALLNTGNRTRLHSCVTVACEICLARTTDLMPTQAGLDPSTDTVPLDVEIYE